MHRGFVPAGIIKSPKLAEAWLKKTKENTTKKKIQIKHGIKIFLHMLGVLLVGNVNIKFAPVDSMVFVNMWD